MADGNRYSMRYILPGQTKGIISCLIFLGSYRLLYMLYYIDLVNFVFFVSCSTVVFVYSFIVVYVGICCFSLVLYHFVIYFLCFVIYSEKNLAFNFIVNVTFPNVFSSHWFSKLAQPDPNSNYT